MNAYKVQHPVLLKLVFSCHVYYLTSNCLSSPPDSGNVTASSVVAPPHSEGIIIGACFAFAVAVISTVTLVAVIVVFNKRHSSKRAASNAQPQFVTLERLQLHGGSGSGSGSGGSELKLVYNTQYLQSQSTIPPKLAPIVENFAHLEKSNIEYLKQLGQGNFGVVFQGKAKGLVEGEEETIVAVKTLKEETALESFIHEAKLMFSFNHPNIIKIFGVCIADLPYFMVVEYMDKGDLAQFLRSSGSSFHRRLLDPFATRSRTESTLSNNPSSLSTSQLLDICKQIAAGMEYLADKNHVHRDLACRNCLVKSTSEGLTVKICDFGMSHNLYTQDYYRVRGQAILPVRWMSPEAVVYGKFSTAGDVWSFGVVMWEVFSFAMQPYFGTSNEEVTKAIRRGDTLSRPADCPHKIYEMMKDCWNMVASDRPSFSELHSILKMSNGSISSLEDRSSSSPSPDRISNYSDLDSDAFYEENSSVESSEEL